MNERNKLSKLKDITLKILLLVISLSLIELLCFIIIKIYFPDYKTYKGNRISSGYTIFYNTPNYCYLKSTIKKSLSEKDLVIDENGFAYPFELISQKPHNTVRIFLIGGSAAFGNGQTSSWENYYPYPQGVYSYESSIAGCLKRKLELMFHDKNFEVINAACCNFTTRQSMMLYLNKISPFHPDFIIEMAGFNDIGYISTGKDNNSEAIGKEISFLMSLNQNLSRSNTIKLIQLINNSKIISNSAKPANNVNDLSTIDSKNYNAKLIKDVIINNPYKITYCYLSCNQPSVREKIQKLDSIVELFNNSKLYINLLQKYTNILKEDSVKLIYVLQPMLGRDLNKKLSDIEKKFLGGVKEDDIYKFFDNYYSHHLETNLERNNCTFIDANKEMQKLDKDFEFYVDYCHLTFKGNEFIAEIIANKMSEQIH